MHINIADYLDYVKGNHKAYRKGRFDAVCTRLKSCIDKEFASLLLLLAFPASVLVAVIALSQGAPRTWAYFAITVGFLTFAYALVKLCQTAREASLDAQEIVGYFEDWEAY
jgi:uncharacterized membrane protein